jgi:hypothetical protein
MVVWRNGVLVRHRRVTGQGCTSAGDDVECFPFPGLREQRHCVRWLNEADALNYVNGRKIMQHVSSLMRTLVLVSLVVLIPTQTVWSGDDGETKGDRARASSTKSKSLNEELATLRATVAKLEAALKEKHQGQSSSMRRSGQSNSSGGSMGGMSQGSMSGSSQTGSMQGTAGSGSMSGMGGMKTKSRMDGGMKGMKPGMKMGMGKMPSKGKKMGMQSGMGMGMGKSMMGGKGMGMMGRMPKMASMSMPSSLPGFPGASHIYHIGSTGFFLDHGEHITLTQDQRTKLNQLKEKAVLEQATFGRQVEEGEQALWMLTGSDKPDATKIDGQVRKIAKIQGDQRIAFIRAVGEAAKILTEAQRKTLVGLHEGEQGSKVTDKK